MLYSFKKGIKSELWKITHWNNCDDAFGGVNCCISKLYLQLWEQGHRSQLVGARVWHWYLEPMDSDPVNIFLPLSLCFCEYLSWAPGKQTKSTSLSLRAETMLSTGSASSWDTIVIRFTQSPRTPVGGSLLVVVGIGSSV